MDNNFEHQYHIKRLLGVIDNYTNLAKLKPGLYAPDFKLKDLEDNFVSLSLLKGKVIYIDFWTTWCGPCRASTPNLKKLYNEYSSKGFELIGIAPDNKEAVESYCKEHEIDWIQIVPPNNCNITKTYGINSYPTGFLIDKDGKIAEIIHPNNEELEFKIKSLLGFM